MTTPDADLLRDIDAWMGAKSESDYSDHLLTRCRAALEATAVPRRLPFNVNDHVFVRLNDKGSRIAATGLGKHDGAISEIETISRD